MTTNEKAHLRGAGFVNNSTPGGRGNQSSVSPRVNSFATNPVIGVLSIVDVWRELGGGELRRGRGRAFWRNGDGFNVALNPKRKGWQDFATNEGGGILALIQTVQDCTRSDALRWLADLTGLALKQNSPERRRRYAEARQGAADLAKRMGWWFESRCEELERLKRLSNGDDGPWDEEALAAASGELYRLHQLNLNPDALIAEFARVSQWEPETRRLIQAGRAQQEQEDEVFGRIVAHRWLPR